VGREGEDRLHSSPRRIVHEKRCNYRQVTGLKKSLAQRTQFRHAHAYVLHQPGGKGLERHQTAGTRKGEIIALKEDLGKEE
jgi:hypothetical protein